MSVVQVGTRKGTTSPVQQGTMLLILAIGTLAFIGMLLLGAYAPDLRSGRNGGTHALSNASVGYSGLFSLARATGRNPTVLRSPAGVESEDLLVITPDHGSVDLSDILERRGGRTTLLILPKWETTADPEKSGWVRVSGVLPANDPAQMLAPDFPLTVIRLKTGGEQLRTLHPAASPTLSFAAPRLTQTIAAEGLEPVIALPSGRVVLGKVPDGMLYVLAEPDLLNNHGISDPGQARAALDLLDFLNSTDAESIMFDVTANGLGSTRSPLRLAFDPPFLAVTLSIFACMVLAAIQALVRFGPVQQPERAIPFGKAALIDNSSALIRKAGREARLGSRYVDVVRQRAAALTGLPMTLTEEELDRRLDLIHPRRSFTAVASAVSQARGRDELLRAAKSLHSWAEEIKA